MIRVKPRTDLLPHRRRLRSQPARLIHSARRDRRMAATGCVSWKAGRVPDFTSENLAGSRFEDVCLTGARFRDVDLSDARFDQVDMTGVIIRGAALVNVDISGEIENLRVNGVDVVPLVEAELNRRYPDRVKMRPADADGYREAWAILERLWQRTVERARGMAPELLHERVEGQWSFIETLRHLLFATDAWVKRAILGHPSPWDRLDLPHDEMPDEPSVPRDRGARPSLDEVLALRADRMATVRRVLAGLTEEKLADLTEPVMNPGYPEPESFAVRRCLQAILNEEWEHRLYAERDLDVLEARYTH
jgi:DinB superfamily/Pentapeptide repeats (8 copies)